MKAWWRLLKWLGFQHQHDWFPGHGPREFIVVTDVCMSCDAIRVHLPYGTCLTGHPLADHYTVDGQLTALDCCPGPS